ncbi:MAG: hypothetical protein ABUK01_04445 [Leptospirales bacterium]
MEQVTLEEYPGKGFTPEGPAGPEINMPPDGEYEDVDYNKDKFLGSTKSPPGYRSKIIHLEPNTDKYEKCLEQFQEKIQEHIINEKPD